MEEVLVSFDHFLLGAFDPQLVNGINGGPNQVEGSMQGGRHQGNRGVEENVRKSKGKA